MPDLVATIAGDVNLRFTIQDAGMAGESMPWIEITQNQTLTPDTAHLINGLAPLTLYLPPNPMRGMKLFIYSYSAAGWVLNQRDGERIQVGDTLSTPGIYGWVRSTILGDYIHLSYVDGLWFETTMRGNLEII